MNALIYLTEKRFLVQLITIESIFNFSSNFSEYSKRASHESRRNLPRYFRFDISQDPSKLISRGILLVRAPREIKIESSRELTDFWRVARTIFRLRGAERN